MSRAFLFGTFLLFTSAVGSSRGPDQFACLRSGSVVEHSSNAPCPLRDRPFRVVRRRPGETLQHFREVRRLCCDRCSPCEVPQIQLPAPDNMPDPKPFPDVTE